MSRHVMQKERNEVGMVNEMCFGESWSLPSLFTIITSLKFSLVICMRCPETQPNCVNAADNINKVHEFSLCSCSEYKLSMCVTRR